MAKEIVLFEFEERKDLENVSAVLHQPTDGLVNSQVISWSGVEELALDITNTVFLEF